MRVLGLDIGSSAVKAAILTVDPGRVDSGRVEPGTSSPIAVGPVRVGYPSRFQGVRAEIDPSVLLAAVGQALAALTQVPVNQMPASQVTARGESAGRVHPGVAVDLIACTTLSPAWLAMDAAGEPLTPIVTHADRRSAAQARALERRVGAGRHLELTGNRAFPGGMASTTWAWFVRHAPALMRRADLIGMLPTYLLRRLTGARVIDPSNASFLGVYHTLTQGGWASELVAAVGGRLDQLPRVLPADSAGGRLTASGVSALGLTASSAAVLGLAAGTPVLVGCVDGSAALLGAGLVAGGLRAGQLVDVVGSTDVLAMCADTPVPHERLLTRALGFGRRWVNVATLASVGSTLDWIHRTLFADLDVAQFRTLVASVAAGPDPGRVRFAPYLAGERTAVRQRTGAFTGLTLATTREQMLSAVVEALARASAERLPLLARAGRPRSTVYLAGGAERSLGPVVHRDWPPAPDGRRWKFVPVGEASLLGLAALASRFAAGQPSTRSSRPTAT